MKVGIKLKIDVSKIDKSQLYKGAKGTYLTVTSFVDLDNKDEYGNNGMVTQEIDKALRDQGQKGAILGNSQVFWTEQGQQQPQQTGGFQQPHQNQTGSGFQPQQMPQLDSEDIPF